MIILAKIVKNRQISILGQIECSTAKINVPRRFYLDFSHLCWLYEQLSEINCRNCVFCRFRHDLARGVVGG